MPVMDGIEATNIRAEPRFRTLPIIAMTANAMASDRERCIQAGMNDFITKPIDPNELFGVIRRWIGVDRAFDPHLTTDLAPPSVRGLTIFASMALIPRPHQTDGGQSATLREAAA